MPKENTNAKDIMSVTESKKALAFHKSIPLYKETPLVNLKEFALYLGVKAFYVKDESFRFGLNAFKALGGSYAIARYIAKRLKKDSVTYNEIVDSEVKKNLGDITFYTATDGNHGRGVAWAANKLGQKSVVFMPKGSSKIRLENILKEGADASVTELNYDDAVRLAAEKAAKDPNGVMVQDTAWDGYEDIPSWIMQGYGTMALEADGQLNGVSPTHVFVQAGVGSLAGAVQGYFAGVKNPPVVTVVEASAADCLYRSAKENRLVAVGGNFDTIMAGLACGEGNIISWKILKNYSKCFVSAPDWVSAKGMRILSSPLRGDERVISGESGAVTTGLVAQIMENNEYKALRDSLGLNNNSVVLVFNTEGDTDPVRYKNIVWNGEYASI
jgi:diaminopropionate ammonia-lyase